jgi:competence protein ComEA
MKNKIIVIGFLIVSLCMVSASITVASCYATKADTSIAVEKAPLNINTASSEELQTIKGIGPTLANRIVEYRSQNGEFASVEDLLKVNGVGEAKLAKMKDSIAV